MQKIDLLDILDIPRKINRTSVVTCNLASAKFPEWRFHFRFLEIFITYELENWAGGLKFIKRCHGRLSQLRGLR